MAVRAADGPARHAIEQSDRLFADGQEAAAIAILEAALGDASRRLGQSHPDVADVAAKLALLRLYRNELDEALELAEGALAVRESSRGSHPSVASSLIDLASIRLIRGDVDEAGALYERVVRLWTDLAGPEDARTLQARANLADFYEAQGRLAAAQAVREAGGGAPAATYGAPPCPHSPEELTPPAWSSTLSSAVLRAALKHDQRIAFALEPVVHRFAGLPSRASFTAVLDGDPDGVYHTALRVHELVARRDAALHSLLALVRIARERFNTAEMERLASQARDPHDFNTAATAVRRRLLVGATRFALANDRRFSDALGDAAALLARRLDIAKLMRPLGYDVNNEIKFRPEFLACVATGGLVDGVDYQSLRTDAEVIARNGEEIDAFLRFAGIDADAVLKSYARERVEADGEQGAVHVDAGVYLDKRNRVAFVEPLTESLTIHFDASRRDRIADLAATVSQWEHGDLPGVSRRQMETLVAVARRELAPGPFADFLRSVELDLKTRYPLEPSEDQHDLYTWARPRVSRWDRTRIGRPQHHTYYEMNLDTLGAFALPATGAYLTKQLDSAVGMLLAIGLHPPDLPVQAQRAFAASPATLHVAVLPEEGLELELYAHPLTLTRRPGVEPIAFGQTPFRPPPAAGWEIAPFGNIDPDSPHDDHVLLDVRPLPGLGPEVPKRFGLHACLLTPLDARSDGREVTVRSPVWRDVKDVPATARFLVYRRRVGPRPSAWTEIAGQPLTLDALAEYPGDRLTRLRAHRREGFLELSFVDLTAREQEKYEYLVIHRCALKPYPDSPPGPPAEEPPGFEIVGVERAPDRSLRCNVRRGYSGIARPWVKVTYRVRSHGDPATWHDRIVVLDPDGRDLARRNAVTTTREPPATSAVDASGKLQYDASREYSLTTSVAACTEGPYRFRITLEGDGFSQEIAETFYVRVATER